MKTSLLHHATIALLASSCALDFSWPLDLVTTCETDAHCPEGLVCRFNSCGRDAVGKDGEPCNLDGRCEGGLLCDEIACRPSRNNEPVPLWDLELGNGYGTSDLDVVALPGGGAVVLIALQESLALEGENVRSLEPGFGPRLLLANVTAEGRPDAPGLLATSQFITGIADIQARLLVATPDAALMAVERVDLDPVTITRRSSVELRGVDLAAATVEQRRLFAREDAQVKLFGASSGPVTPWILLRSVPDRPYWPEDPARATVHRLTASGGVIETWDFPTDIESSSDELRTITALDDERAVVARFRTSGDIGLPEDEYTPAVELLLLESGAEPTRLLLASGSGTTIGDLATNAAGDVLRCHLAFGAATLWNNDSTVRTRLPEPKDVSDLAVILLRADGTLSATIIPLEGIQAPPACAFAHDGTVLLAASSGGAEPLMPGRDPLAVDQDMVVLGLDPADLRVRWTIRHGDGGAQFANRILPTDGGFLVSGGFNATLNFGAGTRHARSGNDFFLARYRMPQP